jgi:hypothetical protein
MFLNDKILAPFLSIQYILHTLWNLKFQVRYCVGKALLIFPILSHTNSM